jgi:hypothetical protein
MLQLPSAQAQEQERAIEAVKSWLESNPGWLLILDNADELRLVEEFLPNPGKGHVLLTPVPTLPLHWRNAFRCET